jgi:uncharacterized cupredoxin-like copper-binding protein
LLARFRLVLSLLVACGLVAVPALAAPASSPAITPPKVKVTMKDFRFVFSTKIHKKGTIEFTLRNTGEASHDLKINGKKSVLLSSGKTGVLRVLFKKAGRYSFICTVPGHATLGMKGVFRVTAS